MGYGRFTFYKKWLVIVPGKNIRRAVIITGKKKNDVIFCESTVEMARRVDCSVIGNFGLVVQLLKCTKK